MLHARRFLIVSCVLGLLLAELTPLATAIAFAILVPIWFFFALVVGVSIADADEHRNAPPFPTLPVFSPRPPPVR
jgi:uncharacterized membrane protein